MSSLTFLAGVGTATGIKLPLEHDGARVLVDCVLFQGLREPPRHNWQSLAVGPASLDVSPPRTCFVVYGEAAAAASLARRVHRDLGWVAVVPRDGEVVWLQDNLGERNLP